MTTFKEAQIIIGIDPDLEKSGVAILAGDKFRLENMSFSDLINYLSVNKEIIKKVVIEAGWKNKKANFRSMLNKSLAVNEQISKRVGENHATGKLLVEMAKSYGLNVIEVKPTRRKLKAEEFNKITGWQGRTNQEVRDAAMLVWGMKGKKVA